MRDLTGKHIGRYKIVCSIASGGMADVYRGYDPALKRYVAIKLIKTSAFSEIEYPKMRKRFTQEAQNLAKLDHQNIVKVYDYGEYENAPYLVMELLEGTSLRNFTGTRLPYQTAAALLAPIADALAYMHSKGLVHRDVKPSNIIIKSDKTPVLADFGISRPIEKDPDASSLTQTGHTVGTPDYMSPEQALGEEIDGRSDEYSLGVIFYELLTGQKLFKGDTPISVIAQHLNSPIPEASLIVPEIPEQVDRVVKKSLAKKPEERYPTMKAFAVEIKNFTDNSGASDVSADDAMGTMTTLEPVIPPPSVITDLSKEGSVIRPEPVPGSAKGNSKRNWLWPILALPLLAGGYLGIQHINRNQADGSETPFPIEPAVSISATQETINRPINMTAADVIPTSTIMPTVVDLLNTEAAITILSDEEAVPESSVSPFEKYNLRFAEFTIRNADSNGFKIRNSPNMDADQIGSSYALIHNGDTLEATGKNENSDGINWIGIRTSDGFEGWIPSDIAEKTTDGIEISVFDDFEYSLADNEITIKKYTGKSDRVIIPSMIEGHQVTSIGTQAFYVGVLDEINRNIKAVVIPEGVTAIETAAFNFCESLEFVSFPQSLKTIESFAFGSANLLSLELPENLAKIGSDAFSYNKKLTSVVIPKNITELDSSVFYMCESLEFVSLPENLESIGINTFMNTALSNIELPKNLKTIGSHAFQKTKLTEVMISRSTEYQPDSFDESVTINYID